MNRISETYSPLRVDPESKFLTDVRKNCSVLSHRIQTDQDYTDISMLAKLPLAANITDPSGCYVDVNKRFLDIVGYRRDELVGVTFWDITPDHAGANNVEVYDILERFGTTGWFDSQYEHNLGGLINTRIKLQKFDLFSNNYYLAIIELA